MKKKLIFVLSLSIFLFTACEEDYTPVRNQEAAAPLNVSSFYPESGTVGTVVAIFGENFGESVADNYVTFNGTYSPVMQVQRGTIIIRVPLNLAQGDYTINVSVKGQTVSSTRAFKVNDGSTTY